MDKIKAVFNGLKYKNNKLAFNIKGVLMCIIPTFFYRTRLAAKLARLQGYADQADIWDRVNYYNKLAAPKPFEGGAGVALKNFKYFTAPRDRPYTAYFFDTYEYTRYFPEDYKIAYEFGDVITAPDVPALVKSRSIEGDNANSVLLNLDKLRHFNFIKDKKPFRTKKDILLGRAAVYQKHRMKFWEMYFEHPMCDLGHVGKDRYGCGKWSKKFMTFGEQLGYKFILCLEGNDVATNLKWVMSSNSVAVMPRPRYETWFMEGRLQPGVHYVEIKADYSDLEQKLRHYLAHPEEAEQIIKNAHAYVATVRDKKKEELISLLVLQKYFEMTGQK